MIEGLYERYQKPIFLSETGHFGLGRVEWIEETASECVIAQKNGVPFWGICIYPVTDRPDWDDLSIYSNCGIFDLDLRRNRIPEESYINSIKKLDLEYSNLF
jgi:beta-glucosidase/6-phospho-beta-glucosidase/beta-galactosidase